MTESSSGATGRGALSELKEAVSNLFEQVVGMTPDLGLKREFPRHEVRVEDDSYRVHVELPGVDREEVDVSIVGRRLTISGTRKRFDPPEDARMLRSERIFGKFELSVQLPAEVDAVGVVAQMRDGILDVRLPKLSSTRGRQVPVEPPTEQGKTPGGTEPGTTETPPPGQREHRPPRTDEPATPEPGEDTRQPGGEQGPGPMPWEDDTTL